MLGLGVAGAVEVFHECDEGGAAGWCEGGVEGDFVGHFLLFSSLILWYGLVLKKDDRVSN